MSEIDEALGEAFVKPESESALAEPKGLEPRDFGFAAWLSGVTPVRETVTIYPDGHSQAEISKLAKLEAGAPKGERAALAEQLRDLYAKRIASGMDFVLEGRTATWVKDFHEKAKAEGVTDPIEVTLRQIAAQLVAPEGVTADHLRQIWNVREADVDALAEAALTVNRAKLGIDPRFLPGASD